MIHLFPVQIKGTPHWEGQVALEIRVSTKDYKCVPAKCYLGELDCMEIMHPIKQKLTYTLIFILGDYSPTPSSLIGALAINLGISVRNLSKDKEEDLRRQYFCWWSRPLPEEHSFRRILCFEGGFGSRGNTPPKVVGAVFRCLVPILSGEDSKGGSVIMPLLASGDQV